MADKKLVEAFVERITTNKTRTGSIVPRRHWLEGSMKLARISSKEAAERLGLKEETLKRWVENGNRMPRDIEIRLERLIDYTVRDKLEGF
jgi:plasmid maintenance system antidote protein VapI